MRKRVSAKLLLAFMCVFYVGANMAHPFTPTLFKNLNLPDYMFGVALACMSVMGFLIGPFWGKSSDVIGRVKIMFIGCIGYSVGQFLFSIAYNIPTVVIARLFSGIFCNATIICSMAYMVDNIEHLLIKDNQIINYDPPFSLSIDKIIDETKEYDEKHPKDDLISLLINDLVILSVLVMFSYNVLMIVTVFFMLFAVLIAPFTLSETYPA